MSNEITITDASNSQEFISFKLNGLKDGIAVGIVSDPNSHGRALSVAYKGEVKIVPLNATSKDIEYLNKDEDNDIGCYRQSDQITELLMNIIKEYKQDLANAMLALSSAKNYIENIRNGSMKSATLGSHYVLTLPATASMCLSSIESIEGKIKHK